MVFKVVRSAEVERDIADIFDHLFASYLEFGDSVEESFARAETRITDIQNDMELLGRAPHQGTLVPHLLQGLRHVTKNQAIFYFELDEDNQLLRILAVFFGGQEHRRHMLKRLSAPINEKGGS